MAVWTVEHFATGGLAFGQSSRSVGVGGTPAAGELVVLVVNTHSDNVAQVPSGFTTVYNGQSPADAIYGAVFAKIAGASGEAASYTVSYSGAAGQDTCLGFILACDVGVDALEASVATTGQTSWPDIPIPDITTTVDEAIHIGVVMGNGSMTGASPAGWTIVGGDGQTRIRAAIKEQPTAGTSTGASSLGSIANAGWGIGFGYTPVTGGGGGPTIAPLAFHNLAHAWRTR